MRTEERPPADSTRLAHLDGRLASLRDELGLDAVIVSSPINTQLFSGCLILTQRLLPDRLAFVVNTQTGGNTFVVCDIEKPQALAQGRISDVRGYTEFAVSPIAALAAVLEEFKAANGVIGFEGRHLVADRYEELRSLLPNAELVAIDQPLARLRAVKDDWEIQMLRSAFQSTDQAIASSYKSTKPGDSTREVADRMKSTLLENGADDVAFLVIGGGSHTLLGHPGPEDASLQSGDPIRVDFGGFFAGYYSDLARSAFVGSASGRQRKIYAQLWSALEETIGFIRPGIEARDVYAHAKEAMVQSGLHLQESNGVWELPHVGHGIGLDIHEFPVLQPSEVQQLEPGMVLCVELLYTEPDNYRLHLEDAVLINEVGAEVISRAHDWSETPVIGRTS